MGIYIFEPELHKIKKKGGKMDMSTCVSDLGEEQLDVLLSKYVDKKNCFMLHPTTDSLLSFDLISGNTSHMFSGGQAYFAEVLRSLSIRRVIEQTIIRRFIDNYTLKEAQQDLTSWCSDIKPHSNCRLEDNESNLQECFKADVKRLVVRSVEETMHDINTECDFAQRVFTNALHFHAMMNLVPYKRTRCVPPKHKRTRCVPPKHTTWDKRLRYEDHMIRICQELKNTIHMTKSIPSHEDTIIVYDKATRTVKAFEYERGQLNQIDIVFFAGVTHETFSISQSTSQLIQTHSLCETVLPIEKYLNDLNVARMRVIRQIGFRSTVIVQDVDEGPLPENTQNSPSFDNFIQRSLAEYKKGVQNSLKEVDNILKDISRGSNIAWPGDIDSRSLPPNQKTDIENLSRLADSLSRGHSITTVKPPKAIAKQIQAHAQSIGRVLADQAKLLSAARHKLITQEHVQQATTDRNAELVKECYESRQKITSMEHLIDRLKGQLDSKEKDLNAAFLAQSERSPPMQPNMVRDIYNQNEASDGDSCVRFINVSKCSNKKSRYLNANFSIPPIDQDLVQHAKQTWQKEVKSMFRLNDHMYTSTGNRVTMQPSYETTSVYLEMFCTEFMGFRVTGRVVFDYEFTSNPDTLGYTFDKESKWTPVQFLNQYVS